MNEPVNSLLPSGFFDLLPPEAHRQRLLYHRVLTILESFGYAEVSPPLMEFENTLLAGKSGNLSTRTFRLMDPLSREMMGIRADITLQVARIAAARLADEPKPLRLCYAGTCLRVTGEGLRKQRQFQQAGAELIGSESVQSDIEIIRVAVASLAELGLGEITVDINLPGLAQALAAEVPTATQDAFREAITHKDRSALQHMALPFGEALLTLLSDSRAAPDWKAWENMAIKLPKEASSLLQQWTERAQIMQQAALPVRLTFDPLEHQGFEYYNGMAFSIFAQHLDSEVGRGGRYLFNGDTPAVGFSIYLNPLRDVMPSEAAARSCYVLPGNDEAQCAELRKNGWITVYALDENEKDVHVTGGERCTHILKRGELIARTDGENRS